MSGGPLSLAEAVAQSLAAVEMPVDREYDDEPTVEDDGWCDGCESYSCSCDDEDEDDSGYIQHAWSEEEYVCSSCGDGASFNVSMTRYGTAYGSIVHNEYSGEPSFEEEDYDSWDTEYGDTYECSSCSHDFSDIEEAVVTEFAWHQDHDCEEKECHHSECRWSGCPAWRD